MSSITKQRIGKYTYLDESVSYWDAENKRPDNKKTRIGKVDLLTGEPVYKQEYLDRLVSEGKSIEGLKVWDKAKEARGAIGGGYRNEMEAAQSILDSVKVFGVVYFLRELSEKIGLLGILRDSLPNVWQEVFALACYLIAENRAVMYCEEWMSSNTGLDSVGMSSQRISELLAAFGCAERNSFYHSWHRLIREQEYVALDITSVSSYSQMESCEWGYNRDGEDLPQVNICMLFGEDSKLPVYQAVYSGSLSDVTTLKATISEFTALVGDTDLMVVMDKGFFSEKNIKMLLGNGEDGCRYRFLICVPFSSKLAKEHVENERADIDRVENVVLTSGAPIRGVHVLRDWGVGMDLNVHAFFNPVKALKEKNEIFGYVASLAREAASDPFDVNRVAEYAKYLNISKNSREVAISIRDDVINKSLATTGWFLLLSNHIDDPQVAHDIYRMKDVVEKSFAQYKNHLGLGRLRVHSDVRMQNKIFIAFIALIIASAIHETMKRKELYKNMTLDSLILTLAKLKSATVSGKEILRPMTKEQTDILKAFDIRLPDYDTLKPTAPKKRGRKPKPKPDLG